MRFSWQDVKKQVRRRADELTVSLHFLQPGTLQTEITRLIAYYEQLCGQARKRFEQDEASACVGDYRLANCLLAVLSMWYAWRQPAWSALLQTFSTEAQAALSAAAITSSVQARLALFDYVNVHHAGFLDAQTRPAALATLATRYALAPTQLADLLALDTEDEAILTRTASAPPSAEMVAALYNQWVFEAALSNASEVHFVIDCEAFLAVQRAEDTQASITGLGTVIKRLCYLARTMGVYYDLAYEEKQSDEQALLLHLTLYGPQDMTGSPQQYGTRLARLCHVLLGYGHTSSAQPAHTRQGALALSRALRTAEATVYVFQQRCRFLMEARLLALLPAPERERMREAARVAETTAVYDSSIEQSFAEAFASLARSHGTAGWQLEREPEPLLFSADASGASGIFLPDFALTRGNRRIYVEILGFWTPAYRERKMHKLHYLKGRADLILALPHEAQPFFASLAADFPFVEYHHQLSATDVLQVLHTRYEDFEERLAALDCAFVQARVREACFVSERACYDLLHCYRRSELPLAIAMVLEPDMEYTPGLGIYLASWLEHLHHSFVTWIEAQKQAELSWSVVMQACQANWPELAACDESILETLLTLWPEVRMQRASIFEANVLVERYRDAAAPPIEQPEVPSLATQRHKGARERRTGSKKPLRQETSQQHLWE